MVMKEKPEDYENKYRFCGYCGRWIEGTLQGFMTHLTICEGDKRDE